MSKLVSVEFLKEHRIGTLYNKEDIAGFDKETADDLIKREIAKPHKPATSK